MKLKRNGTCGVVSFDVAGGRADAERFMAALKLCAIETHVADVRLSVRRRRPVVESKGIAAITLLDSFLCNII